MIKKILQLFSWELQLKINHQIIKCKVKTIRLTLPFRWQSNQKGEQWATLSLRDRLALELERINESMKRKEVSQIS